MSAAGLKNPIKKPPGPVAAFFARVFNFFKPKPLPNFDEQNLPAQRTRSSAISNSTVTAATSASKKQTVETMYRAALAEKNNLNIVNYGQILLTEKKQNPYQAANIFFHMGEAYLKLGLLPKALVAFESVLKLNPKDDLAHENRCETLCRLGRYREVEAAVNAAKKEMGDSDIVNVEQWGVIAQAFLDNPKSPGDAFNIRVGRLDLTVQEKEELEENFKSVVSSAQQSSVKQEEAQNKTADKPKPLTLEEEMDKAERDAESGSNRRLSS